MNTTTTFQVEQLDDILIITPGHNLGELVFDEMEAAAEQAYRSLGEGAARHVVMDFEQTDYYGSTSLSFFVKLWQRVRKNGGTMIFCNVSPHEREILQITHLDKLWDSCGTRDEALGRIRGS